MYSIGLDIGTTSIRSVLVNEKGEVVKAFSRKNDAAVDGKRAYEKLQDPHRILEICEALLMQMKDLDVSIKCIGITGQMHGILYLNEEGEAISPLYSWQDQRGNEIYKEDVTYASHLQDKSGYNMATGFGLTTHYVLTKLGKIPEGAETFCTLPDYIALSLTGVKQPVLHPSMAASLGMFNLKRQEFDIFSIEKMGMDSGFLPSVEKEESILGTWGDIPVSMALGDNQASFLGSVGLDANILVNIGTGGQISCFVDSFVELDFEDIEMRPFISGSYLLVGASLCGGYSYQLLNDFFRKTFEMFEIEAPLDLYSYMNQVVQQADEEVEETDFVTQFSGTRQDPSLRAQWQNISSASFTPQSLCKSVVRGICMELYEPYEKVKEHIQGADKIVTSGNGIRKNIALQKMCKEVFQLPIVIPVFGEETSLGSALFARLSMKDFESLEELKECIHYQ